MSTRPVYGLVTAYLVSQIGTAMSGIAIPWLVLVDTGSAAKTGLIGFAEMAPYVLMQALSGPLADRIGLHRATVAGNLVAAALVASIPALSAAGLLHIGTLAALVAVAGAVRGLADNAMNPMVPGVTEQAGLPLERVTGLYSAANRVGLLVGLPLAGALIGATSAATVVLLDGISFAVAAALIAVLVPASAGGARSEAALTLRQYGSDLRAGFGFLRRDRLLLGLSTMIAMSNLLDQALMAVLLPVWVRERLHQPGGLGVIGGALGLGLLGGVLAGSWLGPRLPRWTTYAFGFLLSASPPFFALALSDRLPPVVVVMALSGLLGGVLNPIIGAVLYERVPAELRARVLGLSKASAWAGIPIGSLLGGVLAEGLGLTPALTLFGIVMLATTLAPFVFPSWRELNRPASQIGKDPARPATQPAQPGVS